MRYNVNVKYSFFKKSFKKSFFVGKVHLIAFYTKTYKRHNEDLYYKDCTVSQFIFLPPNNLVIPQRNRRPCHTVIYSRTDFLVKRKVNKIQLQRLVLLLSFKGGLLTFKKITLVKKYWELSHSLCPPFVPVTV